ncbi:MAG: LVIVD repeat-containing protein [Flammeovirgaceae bacterium]
MKRTSYILLVFVLAIFTSCEDDSFVSSENLGGSEGVLQGSLNKFTVSGDYLYVINHQQLIPYNISNPSAPVQEDAINVGIGIETVITRGNTLFIGANNGMYIFDITDRDNPVQLSLYQHILACDPVAVKGDYAYVTLRSTSACNFGNGQNLLDVVDISDLRNPRAVNSINMDTPYGLGIDGEHLFISKGLNGLDHFSIRIPTNPVITEQLTNIPHNVDVIAVSNQYYSNLLIVTGEAGIYQYDYSNGTLQLISQLSFQ